MQDELDILLADLDDDKEEPTSEDLEDDELKQLEEEALGETL